ncbi:hypothetical protein [Hymenobacter sp. GOD-10R]|nr:hypothetical protein [Hymenobacter sp. GOD-10R]WRQ30404.1 hypothetical protein SD425_09035 [Hymenobacter sp. GOD-10R]
MKSYSGRTPRASDRLPLADGCTGGLFWRIVLTVTSRAPRASDRQAT